MRSCACDRERGHLDLLLIISCQLISAPQLTVLSAAHSKGIIHRDIKPQNVVCSPDGEGVGQMAVIDWGLAVYQNYGKSELYLGTPPFMSVSCLSGYGRVLLTYARCTTLTVSLQNPMCWMTSNLYCISSSSCAKATFRGGGLQYLRRRVMRVSRKRRSPGYLKNCRFGSFSLTLGINGESLQFHAIHTCQQRLVISSDGPNYEYLDSLLVQSARIG